MELGRIANEQRDMLRGCTPVADNCSR